jgi:hypothetical protein
MPAPEQRTYTNQEPVRSVADVLLEDIGTPVVDNPSNQPRTRRGRHIAVNSLLVLSALVLVDSAASQ